MNRSRHWEASILVGAATVCDGQFLLLRRSERESFLPHIWGIPAGQVNEDEDPREACLRELFEETGLRGQIGDLIGYSTFSSKRGAVKLSNTQLNFLVHVAGHNVRLNPASHSAHQWVSLGDMDNELLDDFTRDIIKSARDALKEKDQLKTSARGWAATELRVRGELFEELS